MKKFILYLILSLFITQNVYRDVKAIGWCIGYLTSKIMNEGQSSITQSNLKWMTKNNNDFQAVNKIHKEQKIASSKVNPLITVWVVAQIMMVNHILKWVTELAYITKLDIIKLKFL